jgi:integrase/recombinase XerC
MAYVKTHVVARRNARGGRSAEEHLVAALRCLYRRAVDDGGELVVARRDDPVGRVGEEFSSERGPLKRWIALA